MRNVFFALALVTLAIATRAQTFPASPTTVSVVLETARGEIELALDATRAPATTANFLRYVTSGFYDGGCFHRTVKPDNQPEKKSKSR